MSALFCCCIPVRFGVFLASFVMLLASGLVLGTMSYALIHDPSLKSVNVPNETHISPASLHTAVLVVAIVSAIIALCSFLGFIGSLVRSRILVTFYSIFVWFALLIELASGTYYIIQIVHGAHDGVDRCKDTAGKSLQGQAAGKDVFSFCLAKPVSIILNVVFFVLYLLFALYVAIVVNRYKRQLQDEARWDATLVYKTTSQPSTSNENLVAPQPQMQATAPPMIINNNSYGASAVGAPGSAAPYYNVNLSDEPSGGQGRKKHEFKAGGAGYQYP